MKTIYKYYLIAVMPVLFLIVSCDRFVEVDLPATQLTATAVFEEKATANAAMANVYTSIRTEGLLAGSSTGLSTLLGVYTDELSYYGSSVGEGYSFNNNTLLASDRQIASFWSLSYKQIYSANAVIEGVEQSTRLLDADRSVLKGEALFVRALLHFYLSNLYGSIPYISTTAYEQNNVAKKIPVADVYLKIIADLKEAITLLPLNYVTAERVRPNRFTAHALLARVNLYAGNWDEAASQATIVLSHTALYTWEEDVDKVFKNQSTTTIWQLLPLNSASTALESNTFPFTVGPPALWSLSKNLMLAFSSTDKRKQYWTKGVSRDAETWYHSDKYKLFVAGTARQYSIVFRLAEQYLIRAEARARQSNLGGAKEDLNKIRHTAGLGDTPAKTENDLLNAILDERRLEFFAEYGQRFFDLKRMNKLDPALSGVKPGWNTDDKLFPIPDTELGLNPNLKPQNPGY
jgi:hypothetical protein